MIKHCYFSCLVLTFLLPVFALAQQMLPSETLDFENYDGQNLNESYVGWQEGIGSTLVLQNSDWVVDDFSNISNAENGLSARIRFEQANKFDWILSPYFQFEENAFCLFDLAVTEAFSSTNTSLGPDHFFEVLIRESDDSNFESILLINEASVLEDQYWVDLQLAATDSFQLAFRANTGINGANVFRELFIDNIRIVLLEEQGLELLSLTEPLDLNCMSAESSLIFEWQNTGASALDLDTDLIELQVNVVHEDSSQFYEIDLAGFFTSGSTGVFEIGELVDFSAYGPYEISAWFLNEGNPWSIAPDTIVFHLNYQEPAYALLDTFTFSNFGNENINQIYSNWEEQTGFITERILENSSWEGSFYLNDFENEFGIAAKFNFYSSGTNAWLIGPKFRATESAALEFDLALTSFSQSSLGVLGSDDVLQIYVFRDCFDDPILMKQYDTSFQFLEGGQEENISLAQYAGEDLHVGILASDGIIDDIEDSDLYIDNLAFTGLFLPPPNAGISVLWNPEGGVCEKEEQGFSLVLLNESAAPLTDFEVSLEVAGFIDTLLLDTIDFVIPGNSQWTHFMGNLNTKGGGLLEINAWTEKEGDLQFENDSIETSILVHPFPNLELGEDRSICYGQALSFETQQDEGGFALWSDGTNLDTIQIFETGEYWLEYTVNGCTSRDTVFLEVLPLPVATYDFEIIDTSAVQFENLSEFSEEFTWNFGDGSTSMEEHPIHVFSMPNLYNTSLLSSNACGIDSTSLNVAIIDAGVLTSDNERFSLYPNPVEECIHWKSDFIVEQVELRSLAGEILFQEKLEPITKSGKLDLPELPIGVYVFCLINSDKRFCAKVLSTR